MRAGVKATVRHTVGFWACFWFRADHQCLSASLPLICLPVALWLPLLSFVPLFPSNQTGARSTPAARCRCSDLLHSERNVLILHWRKQIIKRSCVMPAREHNRISIHLVVHFHGLLHRRCNVQTWHLNWTAVTIPQFQGMLHTAPKQYPRCSNAVQQITN